MNWKNNIPLIVGLALPILMIIFVAASIYFPRVGGGKVPQYDFLYVTHDYSYPSPGGEKYYYGVTDGKLVRQETMSVYPEPEDALPTSPKKVIEPVDTAKLYVHNVAENTSKEISFEEAQKLSLDPSTLSLDGFEVSQGRGNQSIFTEIFGGSSNRDYNTWYLMGERSAEKLNLENKRAGYYGDFQFLGWIVK